MTPDIHPHWTSTDSGSTPPPPPVPVQEEESFFPMDDGKETSSSVPQRIKIAKGQSSLLLVLSLVSLGAASLGVVFYQGVNRIRADLLEEMQADSVIEVGVSAFSPASLTIEAGKLLEWKNTGTSNQELRSDQMDDMGSPILASPAIPPGTSFRFRIPPSLGGTTLTVRSAFNPTMSIAITVEPPKVVTSSSVSSVTSQISSVASAPIIPSLPASPSPTPTPTPVPSPSPVPLIPSLPSSPSFPSTPSLPSPLAPRSSPQASEVGSPTPTPVLQVGTTETVSQGVWPNQLRINRFTVGSPLVPAIPSPSPIHSAARKTQTLHPAARKQPETGPALWILSSLTLGTTLFLFRGKRACQS